MRAINVETVGIIMRLRKGITYYLYERLTERSLITRAHLSSSRELTRLLLSSVGLDLIGSTRHRDKARSCGQVFRFNF